MMSLIENLVFDVSLVAVFLVGVMNSAFNLRARAEEEGTATVYRVKLLARLPACLLCIYVIAALVLQSTQAGVLRWSILVLLEAGFVALYLRIWPYKVVLDGLGIHAYRFLHHDVTIAWSDLAQLKRSGGHWNSLKDVTYRFRGSRGTTIKVAESDFETDDILNRVRSLHPCPEKTRA